MTRLRAAIKLVGILAALAAVPAILHATTGNPLPAWPIDWGLVAESLSTGAIATSTWLQVVAVAGWLVWGYLIVALTLDVLATIRNRPSPVRAAPVRWLASTIVALATQLSTVTMTLSPPPAAVQVVAASYEPTDTADVSLVGEDAPDGTRLRVVTEGDSWAGFAQTAVGDTALGPGIRALNEGRDVGGRVLDGAEAFVEAGWRLLVPTTGPAVTAVPTADEHDDGSPRSATHESVEPVGDEQWTVEKGEHFWSIAETTLKDATGTPPSEADVASYWRELIDANEDRLLPPHDPNLIYPGQTLIIPPVDAPGATAATEPKTEEGPRDLDEAESHQHPERQLPDRVAPQPGTPSGNGSAPTTLDDDATSADDTQPWTETGDPTGASDDADEAVDDHEYDDGADEDGDVEVERTGWGTPVGLTAGTAATMLIGAGVLTVLRRRRRVALQQRPVQVRLPPLTEEQAAQAARLDAAAPPGEVLGELADLLCSIPADADPVLVTTDNDGSVILTFDDADRLPASPPAPWEDHQPDDHGRARWAAMLGAPGPRRSIGLPLLVTLGRHGTANVLGNIGAMRLLTVAGDDASAVDRQLRAFALEVATSRTAGPLQVIVAGDADAGATIEQLRPTDDPEAEVAAAAEEVAQGIVADDRVPRLIVCHEPTPVPRLPEHVDLVGIITDADISDARWRLHLDGPRRLLHRPDGRDVVLDSPDFDPDLVTDELATLDATDRMVSAGDQASEVAMPGRQAVEVEGWCEVGLLGPVTVTLGGQPVDTLTPILRQVLAYLATHPGASTDQLEDAVWAGQAAGSGQRVRAALTRLRTELGTTPDGELLVPRRGPGDHHLRLSVQVTTDLDRAFGHLDAAHRLDGDQRLDRTLAALDLVRGAPLQDLAVSWAVDVEHHAIARLQDAALEAAAGLLEAGRLDEAEHAVQQGLKLCDPCEPLYVLWAQIEHARNRPERIPQLWTRLQRRYADDADDTFDTPASPTADTERAFAALAGAHRGAE